MKYLGGKIRLGREIAEVLMRYAPPGTVNGYLEPFCGALGVTLHMVEHYNCVVSDINKDLIMLWKEVKSGKFEYPTRVSKETWLRYKHSKSPSAMRAFIGFGCSYNGMWFSTYAQDYSKNNCILQCKNSIEKIKPLIKKIKKIQCCSYDYWEPKGYLIYCDPPYKDTKRYRGTPLFEYEKFWNIIREWSKCNIVIVSEFKAPKDFKCIWKKTMKFSLINKDMNIYDNKIEKLFIYEPNGNKPIPK